MRGLRRRAGPAAKSALLKFGGYAACRTFAPSRDIAILRYHAICGPEGHLYADPGICVTPEAFDRHVEYLAGNYSVLGLPDIVSRLRDGRPLPRNTVAITFDDGYADNLEAARTLHRYGISATFYITAGCLASGAPFWPIEIRALVRALRGESVSLSIDGRRVDVPLNGDHARRMAVRTLTKLFKANTIPVRESMRAQLRESAGTIEFKEYMLTWEQVAEMHRLGMTIGSHTVSHPNLPNAGLEDACKEISESKATLERQIDSEVTMFSYPNGGAERYMTADVARLVREAGYAAATTSRNAFATRASDLFALERIQVQERLEDLLFALEIERFGFKPQARPGEMTA